MCAYLAKAVRYIAINRRPTSVVNYRPLSSSVNFAVCRHSQKLFPLKRHCQQSPEIVCPNNPIDNQHGCYGYEFGIEG